MFRLWRLWVALVVLAHLSVVVTQSIRTTVRGQATRAGFKITVRCSPGLSHPLVVNRLPHYDHGCVVYGLRGTYSCQLRTLVALYCDCWKIYQRTIVNRRVPTSRLGRYLPVAWRNSALRSHSHFCEQVIHGSLLSFTTHSGWAAPLHPHFVSNPSTLQSSLFSATVLSLHRHILKVTTNPPFILARVLKLVALSSNTKVSVVYSLELLPKPAIFTTQVERALVSVEAGYHYPHHLDLASNQPITGSLASSSVCYRQNGELHRRGDPGAHGPPAKHPEYVRYRSR